MGRGGVWEKKRICGWMEGKERIREGEGVRLRLLECMGVGNREIGGNCVIVGVGGLEGERVWIGLKWIEEKGMIMGIEVGVYENEGEEGMLMGKWMEVEGGKEVGGKMGRWVKRRMKIWWNGGGEVGWELGKGVIEGVWEYMWKKMGRVKIEVKGG